MSIYSKYLKRIFDFIVALISIILLSPILLILVILVKCKLGSPVLFSQYRPGYNEKIFKLRKFRSMTSEIDENGNLLPDDVRLTHFGKLLRSTSLDELPELFNILKGEMSIVGPRPQLVKDMVFMSEDQRKRHSVRPGLTGLAQINGRNAIAWEDKLKYDLQYIENISFVEDVKILFLTVGKVFKREDVTREGTVSDLDFGDYLLSNKAITKEQYDIKQLEAKKILENL